MLKNLKKLGVQPQEQHLAPFIEIYVKKDNLEGVFDIFDQMKQANIAPTERSAQCLADGLWATQNQATLRKIYDILETKKDDKGGVAIPLINAVLRGTGWCSDKVNWWIKLYEDLDLYRTQPNIRTFDALLQLCYNIGDESLSQRIYDDLMSRGATASIANPSDKTFKPTARTYKLLSMIAVKQKSYEAAFHWLEESKAAGFTPAPEFYVNLIRRCAWRNDPRWIPAREEMKSQGYDTAAADKFLRERGLLDPHGNPEPEKGEAPPPAEANRPARKPRRMIRGLPRV
ncbi:hypothetical protein FRB90_009261 [Tulasnella sp. 427]|nr:hypothetical protein FRB90_009261 [Tulasnella sp. 427]